MAGFANNPIFAWEKNSYRAQLRDDLIYEDEDGAIYVVPNRYYTDYASSPRWLWWICSPYDPQHRLPAVLHDYLYGDRGFDPYGLSRKKCDQVFLRAMLYEGQPKWKAYAMYQAVRRFGKIITDHAKPYRPWKGDPRVA